LLNKGLLILLFGGVLACPALAQDAPMGRFMKDSVQIGEQVNYILTYRYPSGQDILFPDSSYNYFPFELIGKKYFATETDSTISLDSVVYTLATYEIDSIQFLSLPVYVLEDGDSLSYYAEPKKVVLQHMVSDIPSPLALQEEDPVPASVDKAFNYPYWLIATGVLAFIVGIVALVFGKGLLKRYRIYLLKKRHQRFSKQFLQRLGKLSGDKSVPEIERTLNFWKQYMEKLDKMPVTKMTTKEILRHYQEQTIRDILKSIDRCIYGGEQVNDVVKDYDQLLHFSRERMNNRIEEIKQS